MNPDMLRTLLASLANGDMDVDEAMASLRHLPFTDVDGARLDHHRELRTGVPEVVFGEGKTAVQVVDIAREMVARSGSVLVTRLDPDKARVLLDEVEGVEFHADARVAMVRRPRASAPAGRIAVLSAGTSDQPVAEEAALTLEFLGIEVARHRDIGVAGLHRLLAEKERIATATVLVVVAGMEGALPSVVAGLVDAPVIAVPTSIGYGASFGGLAALLAMMNSCAPGVTVVNVDNGFGAAVAASSVLRAIARGR